MKLLDVLSGKKPAESAEHRINPVYDTAKSCLANLARAGCEEAAVLGEKLNFEKYTEPGSFIEIGTALFQEVRYRFVNHCIRQSGCKNILDIGCGYSPRGILFANEGYHYVGADIPAVINDMSKLSGLCVSEKNAAALEYIAADATNPEALLAAADAMDGPVCIITEGVLMYFPVYEMKEVLCGIKEVLHKHGGCMYTPDFCMNRLMTASSAAVSGKLTGRFLQAIATKVVGQYTYGTRDEMNPSSWYAREDDEIPYKFFTENGFDIKRIPVYNPEMQLKTLEKIKKSSRDVLLKEYARTFGWKLTLAPDPGEGR